MINRRSKSTEKKPREAGPRARYIWSGTVSFGLVSIPVGLVPAVREGRIGFHLLHDEDHARLERRMVCPEDNKIVPPEHRLRGVEVAPGEYVAFTDEELDAIAPKQSQAIEINDFVPEDVIDPIFYDHSYYLAPQKGGAKPYRLLVDALQRTRKAGIAFFVLRAREYPVAVRVVDGVLCLSMLHFPTEILSPEGIAPETGRARAEHVRAIQRLMEQMQAPFEPAKYADPYREQLMALIQSKLSKQQVVEAPVSEVEAGGAEAEELIKALKKSLRESAGRKSRAPARKTHAAERSRDGKGGRNAGRKKADAQQSRKGAVSRRGHDQSRSD